MAMAKTSLIVGFGRREVEGTRSIRVGEDAWTIRLMELVALKPCLECACMYSALQIHLWGECIMFNPL